MTTVNAYGLGHTVQATFRVLTARGAAARTAAWAAAGTRLSTVFFRFNLAGALFTVLELSGTWLYNRYNISAHDKWLKTTPWSLDTDHRGDHSHWEAIRSYMEYEIHDLKSIQDPLDLQGPNDPPHEGLHTFHNARARMHQQIRDGRRGRVSGFFWYLYHVMTLWTIPNHLTEWEIRRLQKMAPQAMPEVMRQWSEPLPKEQWAKPSEELLRLSDQVRALHKRQPRRPITEIFAEVQRLETGNKHLA